MKLWFILAIFKKFLNFNTIYIAKSHIIVMLSHMSEKFLLLLRGDFNTDSYNVDSDEAHYVATTFFSAFNASSALLFLKRIICLRFIDVTFKEIRRLTFHRRYFSKYLCPPLIVAACIFIAVNTSSSRAALNKTPLSTPVARRRSRS